jgi:predicted DNA-binding transcriptional regulator AlpA
VTGLSKSLLYQLIADGEFPPAMALSRQARGWKSGAVQRWMDDLQPAGPRGRDGADRGR